MKRHIVPLVLLVCSLTVGSCSRSPEGGRVADSNKNQNTTGQKSLAGVAEVVHSFGDLIPANADMVRLMKLPSQEGKYNARQLILNPKPDDMRAIYVGDEDVENIILSRADTHSDRFERYAYLTSQQGELRCIVYTASGSREQRIITSADASYQKAVKDFKDQVMFWIGMEPELRAKFRDKEAAGH